MWWRRFHLQATRRHGSGACKALFAAASVTLLPTLAFACPVCFATGDERVVHSYYITAALMSLLPVVIVAVFAGWLRRLFKSD